MFPDQISLSEESETGSAAMDLRSHFPTVPGYDVLSELGEGGMGIVYLGRQKSLKRDVAIKTLPGRRWHQSGYVDRLRQEARGLSLIDHPNVVKIIDVVETPAAIAIILEYVEGENLASRLKKAAMPPRKAAELALELARTMAFVHQRGLWHRDIKPANILIDLEGNIKIADFGLVKEEGSFSGLTGTGDFFGTPSYMAPEQIPGSKKVVDGRADVYGIGATLYEMLSGRPPFMGVSPLATMEQVQHRDPVALKLLDPGIPRDLETICLRSLEKDSKRRFAGAQELADELKRFLDGVPIRSRPIGLLERSWRWSVRRPAIASLAIVSLVTSAVILSLIVLNIRNREAHIRDLDVAAHHAIELQHIAEGHERQAKDALYIADINRAGIALRDNDTRELVRLLELQVPAPGETDRRGFEWWHLQRRVKLDRRVLLDVGSPQFLLEFAPQRNALCAAGADSILRMFSPDTGKIVREIPTGQIEINGIAFSPDGKEFATAGDDGTIMIWDQISSQERLRFKAQPEKAFQIVYSREGSQIISCGNDPVIRIFDTATGELAYTLEGHQRTVESLLLSDDGTTLVSTSDDHTVRIWSLVDREERMSFGSSGDVSPVIFDRKRNLLIIGDASGEITTIDTQSRQKIDSVRHLDKIGALAANPHGNILAMGDASGQVRLRNLSPQGGFVEDQYQPWHAHQGGVHSLVWSLDGSRLISTGNDGRVVSWNPTDSESAEPKELKISMGHDFCLRPKSTMLLVGSNDDGDSPTLLNQWDWMRGRSDARCSTPFLTHPSISPDGRLFAVLSFHRSSEDSGNADDIRLYQFPPAGEPNLQTVLVQTWIQDAGELQNIRFSPDSQWIAVSRSYRKTAGEPESQAVWLLPVPTAVSPSHPAEHDLHFTEVAERIPVEFARNSKFSPDGRFLVLVTQTHLVHWDLAKKQIVWKLPNSFIQDLAYSPEGTLIAFSGSNRMVQVVKAVDGSIQFQSTSHRASVKTIAFSPDGRLLATGAEDGAIKFWHVGSGQELLELQNAGLVQHLEFTDDGDRLICQIRSPGLGAASADRLLIFDGSRIER